MLIDTDWCWLMLIDSDWCWLIQIIGIRLMLIDSDWSWLVLIDADRCWLILINADWYWSMLIDAQIRFNQVIFCRSVPPELFRPFFVLVCLLQTCGFYLCIVHRTLDACGEHTMCPCSHPSNVDAQCTGVCVPYGKLSPLAVGHIVARQPVIISL